MLAVVLPRVAGEIAGARVDARLIGRDGEHAAAGAEFLQFVQRFEEQRLQLIVGRAGRLGRLWQRIGSCAELYFSEARREQVDNGQRQQVHARGEDEEDGVAVSAGEDVSGEECEQCASDGAGHSADADDGADGAAREHVGNRGEQISRPTLVSRGGQAEQAYGGPFRLQVREQ